MATIAEVLFLWYIKKILGLQIFIFYFNWLSGQWASKVMIKEN